MTIAFLSGCVLNARSQPAAPLAQSTGGSAALPVGGAPVAQGSGSSAGDGGSSAGDGGSSAAGGASSAGSGSLTATPGLAPAACPAGPGAGQVGVWENISPPEFVDPVNMETYSVVVNPIDASIFAAAGNITSGSKCPSGSTCPPHGTGVMKSTDCGSTWTRVSSTAAGAPTFADGGIWAMLIDPVAPDTMYLANGYGTNPTIYKSTDGGVDWKALNPDPTHLEIDATNFVQDIAIDPYDHTHLAVSLHASCTTPGHPLCLSSSTDRGETWTVFNGPTSIPNWTITGWSEGASLSILGSQSYVYSGGSGIWFTKDAGASWAHVFSQYLAEGSYAGSTHIGPDGTLYIGAGASSVTASAAAAGTPPFALAAGTALTSLANSPHATALIDDGVNLYASLGSSGFFWKAPLSNPTAWSKMPDAICGSSNGTCRGTNQMAFDASHHIVYSANWDAGLWRLVTQ